MLKLLAKFSRRLQALVDLPDQAEQFIGTMGLVLQKYSDDPEVQQLLNQGKDIRRTIEKAIARISTDRIE